MRKDARIGVRLHGEEKEGWEEAAERDGFFDKGQANVSGWLRWLAEKRCAQLERKR